MGEAVPMREAKGNPSTNQLGAGITEDSLMEAIRRSGYPMQSAVVSTIGAALEKWSMPGVTWTAAQEEWTYPDPDTGKTRALDALIEMHHLGGQGSSPRIRPVISLLVECKQSELPFIFFTRRSVQSADFPVTSGFPHDEIRLSTDDDPSTWAYPLTGLWGLTKREFIVRPPTAVSLSSARRAKGHIEVSGEDTYNALALPLLKATDHFLRVTSNKGKRYTDGRLIVSVIVVRAPMVAIDEDGSGGAEHVPWVRVHRYEPVADHSAWRSHRLAAFDVVHEDFLPTYLETFRDYAEHFADSVLTNTESLLTGFGFVKGLRSAPWVEPLQIEPRPGRPDSASADVSRGAVLWTRVVVGTRWRAARLRSKRS
jgi:hypothetical protein